MLSRILGFALLFVGAFADKEVTPVLRRTSGNDISTDRSCYHYDDGIHVSFTNAYPRSDDWVGIYHKGANPYELGHPIMWLWTCGTQLCSGAVSHGSLLFAAGGPSEAGSMTWPLHPGEYVAVLARNGHIPYEGYAISHPFTVKHYGNRCPGYPTPHPTPAPTHYTPRPTPHPTNPPTDIYSDRMCYLYKDSIHVGFKNQHPMEDDWVGIYDAHADPHKLGHPIFWLWTCGTQNCRGKIIHGSVVFGAGDPYEAGTMAWPLHPGRYIAILARNGGAPYPAYAVSHPFEVKADGYHCGAPTPYPTHYSTPRPTPHPTRHYSTPKPTPHPTRAYSTPKPTPYPTQAYSTPKPTPHPTPPYSTPRPTPHPTHYATPRPTRPYSTPMPTPYPTRAYSTPKPTPHPTPPYSTPEPTPYPTHYATPRPTPKTTPPTPHPTRPYSTPEPTPYPTRPYSTPEPTPYPTRAYSTPKPTPHPTRPYSTPEPTPYPTRAYSTPEPTPYPTRAYSTPKPTPHPTRAYSTPKPTPHPTRHYSTPKPTPYPTRKPDKIYAEYDCYEGGIDVKVMFDNGHPRDDDWVGIYHASEDPHNLGYPLMWVWSCGDQYCRGAKHDGTIVFGHGHPIESGTIHWPLPAGDYMVVLARNDYYPYQAYAKDTFKVVGYGHHCGGDKIYTDKSSYKVGDDIKVHFQNEKPERHDWVAIYHASDNKDHLGHPLMWLYTCGTQMCSGSVYYDYLVFGSKDPVESGKYQWPLMPGEYVAVLVRYAYYPPYQAYAVSDKFHVTGYH